MRTSVFVYTKAPLPAPPHFKSWGAFNVKRLPWRAGQAGEQAGAAAGAWSPGGTYFRGSPWAPHTSRPLRRPPVFKFTERPHGVQSRAPRWPHGRALENGGSSGQDARSQAREGEEPPAARGQAACPLAATSDWPSPCPAAGRQAPRAGSWHRVASSSHTQAPFTASVTVASLRAKGSEWKIPERADA